MTRPLFDRNNIQPGFHLVLSKDPNEATYWVNNLHDLHGGDITCFYNYGDSEHRSNFESHLRRLQRTTSKVFCSTMNPDVVNQFYWHDIKDLQRRIILVKDGGDGLFVGFNMTEDEPYNLNQCWDVGLQQLRELLWQKGLW